MKTLLKSLVGSRAHGLHSESSDYDYRGVFQIPTSEILSLGYREKTTDWIEGIPSEPAKTDATSYELLHFLKLATHSNPSILEVLVSPVIEQTPEGKELRWLFDDLWNSTDAFNAFCGYSHNQLKKFIDEKDSRPWKYMVARIRTLILGIELLEQGTMTVNVNEQHKKLGDKIIMPHLGFDDESLSNTLRYMKAGKFSRGMAIDWGQRLVELIKIAYEQNPKKETNFDKVNSFLLKMRKDNW